MPEPKKKQLVKSAATPAPTRLSISYRSVIGWVMLFVAMSSGMFVLGVLVGRHQQPVIFENIDIEHDLTKREDLSSNQAVGIVGAPMTAEAESPLDFYEALKDTEKKKLAARAVPVKKPSVIKEKAPEKLGDANSKPGTVDTGPEPDARKSKATPPPPQKPAAKAPQHQKKPSLSEKKEAEKKGEIVKGAKFTVQVAAFKSKSDALKSVADLKKKGFSAYHVSGKGKGGKTWHRVRIGFFKTQAAASAEVKRLKNIGMPAYVVSP